MPRSCYWTFYAASILASVYPAPARAQTVFKIATLAPEGSAWMNLFHEWATAVDTKTSGRVKLKFFAGGVQGDERDAVRKMRLGQINGAAGTGVALGRINGRGRMLGLP